MLFDWTSSPSLRRLQEDGKHDRHSTQAHSYSGGPAGAVPPHALRVRVLQLHPRPVPPHEEEDRPQVRLAAHRLLACFPARSGPANPGASGWRRGAGHRPGGCQQLAGPFLRAVWRTVDWAKQKLIGWNWLEVAGGSLTAKGSVSPPSSVPKRSEVRLGVCGSWPSCLYGLCFPSAVDSYHDRLSTED